MSIPPYGKLAEQIVGLWARDSVTGKRTEPQEYFVYFKALFCMAGIEEPPTVDEMFQKFAQIKNSRIANRPGAMRHESIPFMHLFLRRY